MKLQIDPKTLTLDQARELARHFSELTDLQAAANNTLSIKLSEVLASPIAPKTVDRLLSTINEWSTFLNGVTDKSNAEVHRILGIESSNSTLQ